VEHEFTQLSGKRFHLRSRRLKTGTSFPQPRRVLMK
jgi:hypothetical protein